MSQTRTNKRIPRRDKTSRFDEQHSHMHTPTYAWPGPCCKDSRKYDQTCLHEEHLRHHMFQFSPVNGCNATRLSIRVIVAPVILLDRDSVSNRCRNAPKLTKNSIFGMQKQFRLCSKRPKGRADLPRKCAPTHAYMRLVACMVTHVSMR